MNQPQVAAVVVTYNRRALLLQALAAIENQTRVPDTVIVIDNASSDGSAAVVRSEHPKVQLLEMAHNLGGAGGFAAGIDAALTDGADLVWLMDDDTVPGPEALAQLLQAREHRPGERPVIVASRVEWTNGAPHPMNTPRRKPFVSRAELDAAQHVGCLPIRSASFVSVLIDAAAARERGLPIADYFLWNDDFEYTARLLRHGFGMLCPRSVVVHKTATFGASETDPGARFYYEVRNKVWTLRCSDALSPLERGLYGGATVRRWGRTFWHSTDRAQLWRCLSRGIRDGLRTQPRPTKEILAEHSHS
ncbi:MAG TPA: glycosyltransferase [Jatrophihabitans sp.]|nr:glycosyltransferase [Jatrophihabitans sp.]